MYKKVEACPLCGQARQKSIKSCKDHSISQEIFTIVECLHCHFKFTSPRPEGDQLDKYYESEDYISHDNSSKSVINQLYKLARIFTVKRKIALINSLSERKGNLLDYGCGTGSFLYAAQKNGRKGTGIEPSEKARQEAGKNKNLTFFPDLKALDKKEQFEIITLWHVLEHVEDLNDTLKSLSDLLSNSGKMLIAVPNCASYDEKIYQQNWAAYDVPRHLYHFTQPTFKKLMEKHQLKITQIVPMKLDAFYVSLLSEKHINNNKYYNINPINMINALKNGLKSNHWAKRNHNNYSSLIYVIAK